MSGIVTRQLANPSLPIICGVLVGLALAQGGEKVGRNLGGHEGAWVGFFLMFAIGFALWVALNHMMVKRQKLLPRANRSSRLIEGSVDAIE